MTRTHRAYAPAHDKHLDIPVPLVWMLLEGVENGWYDAETAVITLPGGVQEMNDGLKALGLLAPESESPDATLVPTDLANDVVANLDKDTDSAALAGGEIPAAAWQRAIRDAQGTLQVLDLYRQVSAGTHTNAFTERAIESGEAWLRELTGKDDPTEDEQKQALGNLFDSWFPPQDDPGKDATP